MPWYTSIRSKILIVLSAATGLLMLLIALLFWWFVSPSFVAFERNSAIRDLQRVLSAIEQQSHLVELISGDWAGWNELYDYAQSPTDEFFQHNLNPVNAASTGMDMIALFVADGAAREMHWYREPERYQSSVVQALSPDHVYYQHLILPLFNASSATDLRRLYVFAGDQPVVVVARPIITDQHTDVAGVLLMMRAFTPDRVSELMRNASVEFILKPAVAMQPVFNEAGERFNGVLPQGGTFFGIEGQHQLLLWTAIPSESGDDIFAVLNLPRTLNAQAYENLYWAIVVLVLFMLTLAIVLYRMLVREVLGPLQQVNNGLSAMEQSAEARLQIAESGADELRQLIRSFNGMNEELNDYRQEIEQLSLTDPLTGLPNRRQFEQVIAREWLHAVREKTWLTLMLIDVDYFKRYNDGYGHQAGDRCLIAVSEALQSSLKRTTDMVARIGGEEFVVVLPQTSLAGAREAARRVAENLRTLNLPHEYGGKDKRLTISIGVKSSVPNRDDTIDSWLTAADKALYRAKENGRDQYQFAPD